MVIVLVAARYQKIISWLQNIRHPDMRSIHIIKRNGPKIYLYIDTDLSFQSVVHILNHWIHKMGGINYVYQFYSLYNGMIDYNAYLSSTTKENMPYYRTAHKDMTEEEINTFKKGLLI